MVPPIVTLIINIILALAFMTFGSFCSLYVVKEVVPDIKDKLNSIVLGKGLAFLVI